MKVIISGFLLACLIGCGQAPTAELKKISVFGRMAKDLHDPLKKLIKRVAADNKVAPNVRDAVTKSLLENNSKHLEKVIHRKPQALKRGVVHLDDYHLTHAGGMVAEVDDVAYLQAKDLIDELLKELRAELSSEFPNDIKLFATTYNKFDGVGLALHTISVLKKDLKHIAPISR